MRTALAAPAVLTTLTVALATMPTAGVCAQSIGLKAPPVQLVQRVSIEPGPPVASVAAGAAFTLWADVTPNPKVHVYAAGAKEFTPVALSVSPRAGITASRPIYPPSQLSPTVGVDALVPVYVKTFRIRQPIAVAKTAKPGETMAVTGVVTYQACDDLMCYPPASVAVIWNVIVK